MLAGHLSCPVATDAVSDCQDGIDACHGLSLDQATVAVFVCQAGQASVTGPTHNNAGSYWFSLWY